MSGNLAGIVIALLGGMCAGNCMLLQINEAFRPGGMILKEMGRIINFVRSL